MAAVLKDCKTRTLIICTIVLIKCVLLVATYSPRDSPIRGLGTTNEQLSHPQSDNPRCCFQISRDMGGPTFPECTRAAIRLPSFRGRRKVVSWFCPTGLPTRKDTIAPRNAYGKKPLTPLKINHWLLFQKSLGPKRRLVPVSHSGSTLGLPPGRSMIL